ncbi:uncharacterized protein [Choristoneura fumiferana]|uniref:uncharacterized protein n=1 Tax=Choristoneura fumiferana TaxID=7141 RepID=UPI003D15F07E
MAKLLIKLYNEPSTCAGRQYGRPRSLFVNSINKPLREKSWREVCALLKDDYKDLSKTQKHEFGKLVLKKWTQIRDSCCKYIRKRKNKRHFSPKPYKYFQELAFLQKVAYIPYSRINEENDEGDEESESEGKVSDVEQETDTSNCAEVLIYSGDEIPNEESSGIAVKEENKIDFSAFQRNPYEVDDTMTKYLNSSNAPKQKEDDPNLHFFKGILPAVSTLNEDETLQFQSGVLTLLQTIKKQRQIQKQ